MANITQKICACVLASILALVLLGAETPSLAQQSDLPKLSPARLRVLLAGNVTVQSPTQGCCVVGSCCQPDQQPVSALRRFSIALSERLRADTIGRTLPETTDSSNSTFALVRPPRPRETAACCVVGSCSCDRLQNISPAGPELQNVVALYSAMEPMNIRSLPNPEAIMAKVKTVVETSRGAPESARAPASTEMASLTPPPAPAHSTACERSKMPAALRAAPDSVLDGICTYVKSDAGFACDEASLATQPIRDKPGQMFSELDLKTALDYVTKCFNRVNAAPASEALGHNVGALYTVSSPHDVGTLAEQLHCTGVFLDAKAKWFLTARHCFIVGGTVSVDGGDAFQRSSIMTAAATAVLRRLDQDATSFQVSAVGALSTDERKFLHGVFGSLAPRERDALISRMIDTVAFPSYSQWRVAKDLLLLRAVPLDPAKPISPGIDLTADAAKSWEALSIYGVNPYAEIIDRSLNPTALPNPNRYAVLDKSPICAVLSQKGACIHHACQTEGGMSGSPLFAMRGQKPVLVGIQSGWVDSYPNAVNGCSFSAATNIPNVAATWSR